MERFRFERLKKIAAILKASPHTVLETMEILGYHGDQRTIRADICELRKFYKEELISSSSRPAYYSIKSDRELEMNDLLDYDAGSIFSNEFPKKEMTKREIKAWAMRFRESYTMSSNRIYKLAEKRGVKII